VLTGSSTQDVKRGIEGLLMVKNLRYCKVAISRGFKNHHSGRGLKKEIKQAIQSGYLVKKERIFLFFLLYSFFNSNPFLAFGQKIGASDTFES